MRGGGGGTPASLLRIKEVQTELKMTDDQVKKYDEYRQNQRGNGGGGGFGGGGNGGAGGGNFDMEAFRKAQAERAAAEEKAIKEIISADQWKRLWEIWVQNQGNRAILNELVQKDLGLTDEQKNKIKDLQTKQQEAGAALREKVQNGEVERSEMGTLMQQQQKLMNDELGKVLTQEQTDKLKAMGGKEFKVPQQTGRGGGGGGGL
jgi:hypothetical protein